MIDPGKVSFIVPCRNEAYRIGETLKRIVSECEDNSITYEIIIIDNMSIDGTRDKISSIGFKFFVSEAKTVAGVRNQGFLHSTGNILVFLDSDVHLADGWGRYFKSIIPRLIYKRNCVTGSHCSVPEGLKQPFRSWYKGIELDSRDTHLGTGHMIMHRDLFVSCGMFDSSLKSGEDFEFCQRVIRSGGVVLNDNNLVAYHMGYPDKIIDFLNRESWHGVSDIKDLKSFMRSKVAIGSSIFFALNIFIFVCLIFLSFHISIFLLLFLLLFLTFVVFSKFSVSGISDYFYKLVSSYLYFWGRSLSFFRLFSKSEKF